MEPESKIQNKQWKHWFSTLKEVQTGSVCWQGDDFCFLNSEGVIMIDYPEKGKTIYGQFYTSELRQQKEVIKSKHKLKLRAYMLLLRDNIPIYNSQVQ